MNSIQNSRPGVIRYGITHFNLDVRSSHAAIGQQVQQDLADSGFEWSQLVGKKILLDLRSEGHDDKDIQHIVSWFRANGVDDLLVAFNCVVDVDSLDYAAFCVPTHWAVTLDWFDDRYLNHETIETHCDFLCMMRTPTQFRAQFAAHLLQRNLDIRLSFGAGSRSSELQAFQPWFPNHTLPLILDGTLYRDTDYKREFDITDPLLVGCAVNVIVESSEQHEPNRWTSRFITEKTFKAFALRQIPIWCAVPGLVECVRNLGFDVFDDVVNHSYDTVQDAEQRMLMVSDEISRLQDLNLAHTRQIMQDRLRSNCEKLQRIINNYHRDFELQLDRFINV